jgi:hypothetical protein
MDILMKPISVAILSFTLATAVHADTIALGVGAVSPSEVVVKIDGRDVHLSVNGTKPSGDSKATTFLQCLVAGRVLRVQKTSAKTANVTMLDGSVVGSLVNEFLDTTTKIDPCALGKAAYQPQYAHAAAGETSEPVAAKPAKGREIHVSQGSSKANNPEHLQMPREVTYPERPYQAPPPKPPEVPTIATPGTMSTSNPGTARAYTPPTSSTTTIGTGSTTAPPVAAPYTPAPAQPYTPPVTQQKPPAV